MHWPKRTCCCRTSPRSTSACLRHKAASKTDVVYATHSQTKPLGRTIDEQQATHTIDAVGGDCCDAHVRRCLRAANKSGPAGAATRRDDNAAKPRRSTGGQRQESHD